MAEVCTPAAIRWCDGSQNEYNELCDLLVASGTFKRLNPERWPTALPVIQIRVMWQEWKIKLSFVAEERKMLVPLITG
jgi:GTP-dependent phosphoenolpyruvate carboxykinase